MALRIVAKNFDSFIQRFEDRLMIGQRNVSPYLRVRQAAILVVSFNPCGGMVQKIIRHRLHQGKCRQMRRDDLIYAKTWSCSWGVINLTEEPNCIQNCLIFSLARRLVLSVGVITHVAPS